MDQLPVSNSTSPGVAGQKFQYFGSRDRGLEVQGCFQLHSEIKSFWVVGDPVKNSDLLSYVS